MGFLCEVDTHPLPRTVLTKQDAIMDNIVMSRLQGKRIIVTRSRKQAGCLIRALEKQSAEVLAIPVIEIQDPADPGPLEYAAAHAGDYDLVIFTSANGVAHFVKRHPAKIRGAI